MTGQHDLHPLSLYPSHTKDASTQAECKAQHVGASKSTIAAQQRPITCMEPGAGAGKSHTVGLVTMASAG